MSKEKIYIFDTTLRDGAQTEGVNFSIDDKNKIAKALADLGFPSKPRSPDSLGIKDPSQLNANDE